MTLRRMTRDAVLGVVGGVLLSILCIQASIILTPAWNNMLFIMEGPEQPARALQFKLTVNSIHDNPNPSNGDHFYNPRSIVACNVTSPVTKGSTVWTCTGWSGAGDVPSTGNETSTTFTMTQNSSITWNWQVQNSTFEDDFEYGNFSKWTGNSKSVGETTTVVSTISHHGSYSGQFTSDGKGGMEEAYCYENISPSSELYACGYFYTSKSGIANNTDRFCFIVIKGATDNLAYAGWRKTNGIINWTLAIEDGKDYVDAYSSETPLLNRWYCVELHWKRDAANGLGELWVDGTLVCNITGKNTSAHGAAMTLRIGLPEVDNCGSTTVYADCMKMGTTYISPEPKVDSFTVSPNLFSPNGDGASDTTTVKATFNVAVNWSLQIRSSTGTVFRVWMGTGSSLSIIWDGKNSTGSKVLDRSYTVGLNGTDLSGITFTTTSLTATVDTELPTVTSVSISPTSFSPKTGGTTKISYTLSESCYVTIQVYDSGETLVRTLLSSSLQSSGEKSVTWNGKTSSGTIVPAGTYTVRIYVADKTENKATPYPITKTVKVTSRAQGKTHFSAFIDFLV